MKIAHINKNNQILGWYDKEIHTSIPTPNIEVIEEQWQIAINSGHNKVNKGGITELFDFRTDEEIKANELNIKIQEAINYLSSTDYKMTTDYDGDTTEVKIKRAEAREFIRANS